MSCEQKNSPAEIVIEWGGKVYRFRTLEEARAAGFQL